MTNNDLLHLGIAMSNNINTNTRDNHFSTRDFTSALPSTTNPLSPFEGPNDTDNNAFDTLPTSTYQYMKPAFDDELYLINQNTRARNTTQQPMAFAPNDNQIQSEQSEVAQPYPSSLHSKCTHHSACSLEPPNTLRSLNTLQRTSDLFILLLSTLRIATERIFAVIVSCIAVIASSMQRPGMAYYVMVCLLTMQTASTDYTFGAQCGSGNDGYLYYFDIYPQQDNKTELELEIASANTNNGPYYEISIYIKSQSKACISPTYTVSYYQDNLTILTTNNQPHNECIHSHQTAPCPPVMQTCIVNNANTIKSNGFANISLSFPPQHECNASDDLNLKLSVECSDVNYNISCSEDEPCRHESIRCLEGTDCFIHCQNYRECDRLNLRECSACYNAVFHCPDNGECVVNCIGDRACVAATFYVHERFRMTNGGQTEQIIVEAIDGTNYRPWLFTTVSFSKYGNETAILSESSEREVSLDFCDQCTINVTGFINTIVTVSVPTFKDDAAYYDTNLVDPLFIITCIVYGLFIFAGLPILYRTPYHTLRDHGILFIYAYSRVILICFLGHILSAWFIASIFFPIFIFVFAYITSDMKSILNEHTRRREPFEPDVTINSNAPVLFIIYLLFSDLNCALSMFKYTVFGIESKRILNNVLRAIGHRCPQNVGTMGMGDICLLFVVLALCMSDIVVFFWGLMVETGAKANDYSLHMSIFISFLLHMFGHARMWLKIMQIKQTYSFMKMECKFAEDEMGVKWNTFTNARSIDVERILTNCLVAYLKIDWREVENAYCTIEVVRIQQGNMVLHIEYDDQNGTNIGARLEMESYLHQHLAHQNWSNYLEAHTGYAPIITLQGQYETGELHQRQVEQLVAQYKERWPNTAENLMSGMKPLHTMSSLDLTQLITYWILTDQKQCVYRTEIMTIIKTKNIDEFIHHNIRLQEQEKIEIAKYLENILGDYINSVMMQKIGEKLEEYANISAQRIGELICMFPVDAINALVFPVDLPDAINVYEHLLNDIQDIWNATHDNNAFINTLQRIIGDEDIVLAIINAGLLDNMDGLWVATHDKNAFINKLQAISGMDRDDVVQIHRFLMKYYVNMQNDIGPMIVNRIHKQFKIENDLIHSAVNERYAIDFEALLIKIRNNKPIVEESKQLFHLCEYLVHNINDTEVSQVTNYHLLDEVYKAIADILSVVGLDEWLCSECCNEHKFIKIYNKTLKPNDKMMQQCIVCGCDKIVAIVNSLKGATKRYLLSANELIECKLNENDNGEMCEHYHDLLDFMTKYSAAEYVNSIAVLSQLSYQEIMEHIISPAISRLDNERDVITLREISDNDQKEEALFGNDGLSILSITEEDIQNVFNHNNDISISSIKAFYDNMMDLIETFLHNKQSEIFGIPYATAISYWKHALRFHGVEMERVVQCESRCLSVMRVRQRRQEINERKADALSTDASFMNRHLSEYVQQLLLVETYERNELDISHINMCHSKSQAQQNVQSDESKSLPPHTKITMSNIDVDGEQLHDIGSQYDADGEHKNRETIRPNQVKNNLFELGEIEKSRYMTDIGQYGFGVNHQHLELGPHRGTMCLKDEILKTKHGFEELWSSALIKAFGKYKERIGTDNAHYHSKQSNDDYNIHRGDMIALKHILAICLYTDNSNLCTDYRSTFRRLETDKNTEDVVDRFRSYYFLSRFLFEAIEFWGSPLKRKQVVYHGLNKELLFERFSHHFHAPMSTTRSITSAANFAAGGILLYLKNGNKEINEQYAIAQFEPNQPRFLDVRSFSTFSHEDERLFFGNSVIFEIVNMRHMQHPEQIPNNTLHQFNLLQRIIKNKQINWEKEKQKNIKSLANKLHKMRQINVATMEYDSLNDEVDVLERYLATDNVFDDAFIAAFVAWYKNNQFDRDSLVADIGERGDKNESNIYSFLLSIKQPKYFELIYESLSNNQRLKQSKELYYMKLLQFFTMAQSEFISIYNPFHPTFPSKLALQMFKQDVDDSVLSITKLTDLFYNVEHIQLSGISRKTMIVLCCEFCKAVIRYSINYKQNKSKKLKSIRFKSETINNAKSSDLLKRKTKEYQKDIDERLDGVVEIRYVFEYETNHILQFNIKQVKDLKTERY